jgi:hypothetical protein
MEGVLLPIAGLDVSYGDALAPPGMRRIADVTGSGIDVNLAHGVPTFVWYQSLKSTAGGCQLCVGCFAFRRSTGLGNSPMHTRLMLLAGLRLLGLHIERALAEGGWRLGAGGGGALCGVHAAIRPT